MALTEKTTPDETEGGRFKKLGELKRVGGRSGVSAPALRGFNLNNSTLSVTMPMETFREISAVANEARIVETGGDRSLIAQRPLDKNHAKALALYMLRGMLAAVKQLWLEEGRPIPEDLEDILVDIGAGPYQGLQPLTGNIRECAPHGADLDVKESSDGHLILYLRLGQLIFVIDGQHRRHAYDLLVKWLQEILLAGRYSKRGIWMPQREDDLGLTPDEITIWSAVIELTKSHFTVDVTVHLGLKPEQERQLFHDLNNLGKKPDPALAQAFDHANPVSVFIRNSIEEKNLLGGVQIADLGSKKGGKKKDSQGKDGNNAPTIYRDDLATANALLFGGATNQAGVMPNQVNDHIAYGEHFWHVVASQPHFGAPDWQRLTLLAEPVMIKALAQLAYSFHGSREKNDAVRDQYLAALAERKIDFSPTNPLWALYLKSDTERDADDPTLSDYLTPDASRKTYAVIRDGRYDFASNTRDIARYLGDLIRWQLKLPPRPGLTALKVKLAAEATAVQAAAAPTEAAA